MLRIVPITAAFLATSMAADLPIRTIVIYKNGLGYFERRGPLAAGESARLDFKSTDMNDVLKSLTLEDRGGGKITGIRYDSSEPLAQKLAEFPFQVGKASPLAAFLDQVKGASIEMKFGVESLAGAIVSARLVAADKDHAEREQVVVLLDTGDLRTLDVSAASSVRFSDPKLQVQLKDYLAAVSQARSKDKRSVYIDSADTKARDVIASYTLPMGVWKSSYRLVFGDKPQPTLEGWAIVDNTTGEDWTKVQIAVVSGRPVSFISRLYDAKFVQRQTVDLPEDLVAGPILYEGGLGGAAAGADQTVALASREKLQARIPLNKPASAGLRMDAEERAGFGNISVDTEAHDLGDLFEYRFATPITVKKDESAMLPFVQQPLSARKLLIYSESYGRNPMAAAELTNSTGKTLDGGPITVFDGASYAGEALMETLKSTDKRLISYAVDLGTRITTLFDSGAAVVREIHVNRGVLTTRSAMQETKTYTIKNVDQKGKTLVIEHPERPQYTLLNQKPTETTASAYRFEVKLAPGATEKFPVAEEHVFENSTAVSTLTPDNLLYYVQNKAMPDAGRKQVQQILDQKRQIASLADQIQQLDAEIAGIVHDQDRIRQNINSLRQVSGQQDQVQKYSHQLADQETDLASKRDKQSDLKKQKTALEAALNSAIEKLSF
jgi:hypothetical protein